MYLRIASLTGAKNNSPASTTPPPMIIACGSSISEYDAHAKPSQSACLLNADSANSLPAFAAFVNAVPDNLPPQNLITLQIYLDWPVRLHWHNELTHHLMHIAQYIP